VIDKRIGQTSSKLSEEDKMRLRFMREQRDQIKKRGALGNDKRRKKFNLEDDLWSEDGDLAFTHKGKNLAELDDFKDEIP